jgi:hypothetical protein
MVSQHMQIDCRNCGEIKDLKTSAVYADGAQRLVCSCCEQDGGVQHRCPQSYASKSPEWLPLLIAGIGIVCPNCKRTYDFGVSIEPIYPEEGQALKAIGLFIGTIVLVGVIDELLRSRGRRR